MNTTIAHRPISRGRRALTAMAALLLAVANLWGASPATALDDEAVPPNGNVVRDPSFTGGVDYMVYSMARQSDGKIVSYGRDYFDHITYFTRVTSTGAADPTFTSPVLQDADSQVWITAQPDDKLVISGDFTAVNGVPRPGLARLNADGTLDNSFAPSPPSPLTFNGTGQVALQPDGAMLLAGEFMQNGAWRSGLARFTSTGAYDASFSTTLDRTYYGPGFAPVQLVVQHDGKVLLGGGFNRVNGVSRNGIARVDATGALDGTFTPGGGFAGPNCQGCTQPVPGAGVNTLALQPDGKVLVGGAFTIFSWYPANQLIRLNPDGHRDPTFDAGSGVTVLGKTSVVGQPAAEGPQDPELLSVPYQYDINALAVQPDGKVVIAGRFEQYRGTQRAAIARVNPNGSLDLGFDPGGGIYGSTPTEMSRSGSVFTMMITPAGQIVVGGAFFKYDQVFVPKLIALIVEPQHPAVFTPLPAPVRVHDTRIDGGPIFHYLTVNVARGAAASMPANTSAVAVNLTVTGTTASGYATLSRADHEPVTLGGACPSASALNWSGAGQTVSNATTTFISGSKQVAVCIFGGGSAEVIVDVTGYYAPAASSSTQASGTSGAAATGALFVPLAPVRAYDSRTTGGPLAGGTHRTLDLAAGAPGALPPGATAVAYNLTITGTTSRGYLAMAPGGTTTQPGTSVLNWASPLQTVANAAQVGMTNRTVEVFAGGPGTTHVVLDIVGYFAPPEALPDGVQGLAFLPIAATRAYDSRTIDGPLYGNPTTGAPGTGRTTSITLGGALPANTGAIAANLTATGTTGSGYLTTSPQPDPAPGTSVVNWPTTSTTLANASITGIGPSGELTTWAGGRYSSHYLIDLTGYYIPAP